MNAPFSKHRFGKASDINHDKIRVAYLSADFREHPVSFLWLGYLSAMISLVLMLPAFRLALMIIRKFGSD